MKLPKLFFSKTHRSTGIKFVDYFGPKNCADWYQTPFGDLHVRAAQRIRHWNDALSDWQYELIGWNVEGLEP